MRNITKIFIVVFSLILLLAVSCSNDDKTGVANNPPENDTEITDGETGSGGTGSGSGSGGSSETGTGGETGGSGSGSETGGSGTGGSGEGGTGTGGSGTGTGGSGEGGGGTETPPTPSEPEIVIEIEEKDFPPELLGTYRDERLPNGYKDAKVSSSGIGIWMKGYQMRHKKDGSADGIQNMDSKIKKWKKTTKGGKIIKLEGESFSKTFDFEKHEETIVAKTVIIYDYENKTVSMTFTTYIPDGVDASFYGKKIE